MISTALLKRNFRRRAHERIIYRSVRRKPGELNSRPRTEYENRVIEHVVIKARNSVHADSERGVYVEGEQEITWNPEPDHTVKVEPGDRINIGGTLDPTGKVSGGEEFEILRHSKSERIPGFILQRFQVARIISGGS